MAIWAMDVFPICHDLTDGLRTMMTSLPPLLPSALCRVTPSGSSQPMMGWHIPMMKAPWQWQASNDNSHMTFDLDGRRQAAHGGQSLVILISVKVEYFLSTVNQWHAFEPLKSLTIKNYQNCEISNGMMILCQRVLKCDTHIHLCQIDNLGFSWCIIVVKLMCGVFTHTPCILQMLWKGETLVTICNIWTSYHYDTLFSSFKFYLPQALHSSHVYLPQHDLCALYSLVTILLHLLHSEHMCQLDGLIQKGIEVKEQRF